MSERDLFEKWAKDHYYYVGRLYERVSSNHAVKSDRYSDPLTMTAWLAWQARAEVVDGKPVSD